MYVVCTIELIFYINNNFKLKRCLIVSRFSTLYFIQIRYYLKILSFTSIFIYSYRSIYWKLYGIHNMSITDTIVTLSNYVCVV